MQPLISQNPRPVLSRIFGTSRPDCPEQKRSNGNGTSVIEPTFPVAKYDAVRVLPSTKNPTDPKGLYKLSNLDQFLQFPMELLFSFQTNSSLDVGRILKQSLSKVMEVYYPLAGRLKVGSDCKMVVDCNVEDGGIPFAEAFSDEDMAATVGDVAMIDQELVRKLVHSDQNSYETIINAPALEIQVTRFKCGGMILGVKVNHVFMDGIALGDFMISWSEIARGLPLSIKPHLNRSIIAPRTPPKIQFPHHAFSNLAKPLPSIHHNATLATKSFLFTPAMLSRLRELATRDDDDNKNEAGSRSGPTTFELISSLVWACWTKARRVGPEETARIVTAVDCRGKLQPPAPRGYFGNCIVASCAQSKASEITSQPLSHTTRIVHDAITEVTEDYVRSTIDFHEIASKPLQIDHTIWITKWTRLPYHEIDFGWGVPSQIAPGAIFKNLVIYFSHGKDSKNIVISLNLPVDAMDAFQELIMSQLKS